MASYPIFLSSSIHKPLSQTDWPSHQVFPKAFFIGHSTFGRRGGARTTRCSIGSATTYDGFEQHTIRRSANYQPSYWDFDQVQSLGNKYSRTMYKERVNKLKVQVKSMLHEERGWLSYLELIDDLLRLGISYHFEDEIQSILERLHQEIGSKISDLRKQDLYATALVFRLLRQHNFDVSQDIFDRFVDPKGDFDAKLCQDTKGLLQLYEASFYVKVNEKVLELENAFAGKHLNSILNEKRRMDPILKELVLHALDSPLHWRTPRLEAREFIDLYEKMPHMNHTILELAKLDFNVVQATHVNDLKYASKWWKETRLAEKLPFSRDRVVENFFWTIGIIFEPQYGYCRRMMTKTITLITAIDDIYDIYGTLEELELFTQAVQSWDIKETRQLPEYMKHCYLQLYNSINEMASVFLQEQGIDIILYLRKEWTDLCKAYLKEAKWYYSGYIPSLQEYLENAWISISAPLVIVHAFFLVTNSAEMETLECLDKHQSIIRCAAMIFRLADDLGTSSDEMKRGDVPKSLQCQMIETGSSEEEARAYIRFFIGEMWKEMNKEVSTKRHLFTKTFIKIATNHPRMAHCMYLNGDRHGHPDFSTRSLISSILFQPITLAS